MNFLGGPSDVLFTLEEGDEGSVNAVFRGPSAEADLDGGIGAAFGGASGLEVDGGEGSFRNLDGGGYLK